MRIHVLTFGSRGDVQPFVALSVALKAAGHEPILVAGAEFAHMAETRGIAFRPLNASAEEMLKSDAGQEWLRSGGNPIKSITGAIKAGKNIMEQIDADMMVALEDAEAVVATWTTCGSYYYLRPRNIPWIGVYLQPMYPSWQMPAIGFRVQNLGRPLNYLTHRFLDTLTWQLSRGLSNHLYKARFGKSLPFWGTYPDFRRNRVPMCFAVSPSVVPQPRDWPEQVQMTGYLYLHDQPAYEPPPVLKDFLASGPPPVYVGFGSMADREGDKAAHMVIEAVRKARARALLMTGWGGLKSADSGDDILQISSVPHEWLFPQMAAVVHHGGAGTTAAGLWSGVPSVVVPFFADQPWWGWRVHTLGAGPKPVPRWQLTASRLAEALEATRSPQLRAQASALGARIRAENGGQTAVRHIEESIRQYRSQKLLGAGR